MIQTTFANGINPFTRLPVTPVSHPSSHARVIAHVTRTGSVTTAKLAEALNVSASMAKAALRRLVMAGVLERYRARRETGGGVYMFCLKEIPS